MRKNGLGVVVLFVSLALCVILSAQERIDPADAAKCIWKVRHRLRTGCQY